VSNDQPSWTFSGAVIQHQEKQTAKGKTFHLIAAARQDGDWKRVCVCDFWGALPVGFEVGADIYAEGRMNGREYQGKYYAGLTATRIEVRGEEPKAQPQTEAVTEQAATEQAENETDSLPF